MMIRRYKTVGRIAWFIYRHSPFPLVQMYFWPPRAYVKIEHDSKMLLVQNCLGSGKWSFPGGGVHLREDTKDGACREVYEEIRLTLSPSDIDFLTSGFTKYLFGGKKFVIYETRLKKRPIIKHGPELTGYAWVGKADLKNFQLTNAVKVALNKDRKIHLL